VDIVDFLSERLDEDEAAARKLLNDHSFPEAGRWYERRLLLECESKRRLLGIVETARQTALATMVSHAIGDEPQWIPVSIEWTTRSLNAMALPYSDHPDFEKAWLGSP